MKLDTCIHLHLGTMSSFQKTSLKHQQGEQTMGRSCGSTQPINHLPCPHHAGSMWRGLRYAEAFWSALGVFLPNSVHKHLVTRVCLAFVSWAKTKTQIIAYVWVPSSPHTYGHTSPSITSHPCSTFYNMLDDRHPHAGAQIPDSFTSVMQQ